MSRRSTAAVMVFGLLFGSGCSSGARMVQWGPEGGVVAIPSNSNAWPSSYPDRAEALMKQGCPAGYVVDREAEVVVGHTTSTQSHTDTDGPPALNVGGLVNVPLGETHARTHETTSEHDVTEWRIW